VRLGLDALIGMLAETAVELGQTDVGVGMLDELRRGQAESGLPADFTLAYVEAVVTGDRALARKALLAAREVGRPWDIARCCLLAVGVGQEDNGAVLREAQQIFRALGSDRSRVDTVRLMRAQGIAVPRRRRRGGPELSDVELRMVALISDGLTNRQISGRLKVSEKTVEGYLTKMFVKTGCRTRVQLAAAHLAGQLDGASPAKGPEPRAAEETRA
jgi:DNA-binding CsgD family transcriptional regulator